VKESSKRPITRYNPPTRFDRQPYNTLCSLIDEDNNQQALYIQTNPEDATEACWVPIGDILQAVHKDLIDDEKQRHEWIIKWKYQLNY
jgi:hypothetical protein